MSTLKLALYASLVLVARSARAADCEARLVGAFDGIIAGAYSQCVSFDTRACTSPPQWPVGTHVEITQTSLSVQAFSGEVVGNCAGSAGVLSVELRNVPAELPTGPIFWQVLRTDNNGNKQHFTFGAATLPSVSFNAVDVRYDPQLETKTAGFRVPAKAEELTLIRDRWADVPTQAGAARRDAWGITNFVSLGLPDSSPGTMWCVESLGTGYLVDDDKKTYLLGREPVVGNQIAVVIPAKAAGPARVRVTAVAGSASCAHGVVANLGEQVLSTNFEDRSLPLQFRDRLVVRCDGWCGREFVGVAGTIITPLAGALDTCEICYSPSPSVDGKRCRPVRAVSGEIVQVAATTARLKAGQAARMAQDVLEAFKARTGHVDGLRQTPSFGQALNVLKDVLKRAPDKKTLEKHIDFATRVHDALVAAESSASAAEQLVESGDDPKHNTARSAAISAEKAAAALLDASRTDPSLYAMADRIRQVAAQTRAAATTQLPIEDFARLRQLRESGQLSVLEEAEYRERRRLAYHGVQTLQLELVDEEDKAIRDPQVWNLDPVAFSKLPLGLGRLKKDAIYVRIRLNALSESAHYPSELVPATGAATRPKVANVDHAFDVGVLHRGNFGLPLPIRAFATASLVPVGFRFPASAKSLTRSSQPRSLEITTAAVSALFVVEPWNWEQRENPTVLGLRFGGGMRLVQAGTSMPPSLLLGAGFSLPLLEASSQLGTSLALWGFWERELSRERSYFLVTLSVDVLTLFSGNTGALRN